MRNLRSAEFLISVALVITALAELMIFGLTSRTCGLSRLAALLAPMLLVGTS
ncbi:MAG TPA: hypothetical protein VNT27_17865 [Propionibacteriaceae bacterium]|nr:hypothetical protein [Propionibacteriaceae bacterium]